ncbi:MAG: plasma-membrane proton-efflux P-type ATPase [Candidatus Bathyarchaeota archaeon]|nr:plasma-membrane proton-efflux P-type ATPase [Candidatus Bathyarchaeota archaeon]
MVCRLEGLLLGLSASNQASEEETPFEKYARTGLSSEEVEKTLQYFGTNEIPEKKVSPIRKFLSYFWGPIPWMIEAAAGLSVAIQHWEDFAIIFTLLVVNAVVGFWQEHKADNAIAMLQKRLAPNARVLRDGVWKEIPAKQLVPGDVVRVRLGDTVPADIKLMNGDYLLLDESALTGESLPVEKHISDIAFSGSIVRQGEMNASVVGTGITTFFGKTAKLVEEAKTGSHFQKAVLKIGNYLIALAAVMVSTVLVVTLLRSANPLEILQFALVLVVAAIPVALPAVLTVTMAVGAIALAKKEAIVSKLVAIEEMAGVDVLCSDKTGTITKNELTVVTVEAFGDYTVEDTLLFGALASREENNDPIDDAVLAKAKENKKVAQTIAAYKVLDFKPFDPVSKRTEANIQTANATAIKVSKGAPQIFLSLTPDAEMEEKITEVVNSFASKGYRALAVAKSEAEGKWRYIGLLAVYDPPREDSAQTIKTAQDLGINVKMVTGDHIAVSKEISREVNLGSNVLHASEFVEKTGDEVSELVDKADGFAQVFPEHKYRIVQLLQERGHIVGMTGDGVNDAPALKKADAGIAVAGATDAAKSAADVVLTKMGLSVIIDTIEESRKIFQRMNNYAIYRIAETVRVLIFLTLAILVFDVYPLTAVMIIILALLNDLPIMMIAYDKVKIQQNPVRWNMHSVLRIASLLGTTGVISSFVLFLIGTYTLNLDPAMLQTLIFLKMTVGGHMTIYLARTGTNHFWERPFPAKSLFFTAEITQVIGTLIAVYGIFMTPLGWELAALVWGYALLSFAITDILKTSLLKHNQHQTSTQTTKPHHTPNP